MRQKSRGFKRSGRFTVRIMLQVLAVTYKPYAAVIDFA